MGAETLVELYRFDEDEEAEEYDTCCTLVFPDPSICFIKGLASPITTDNYRELREYLRERGVEVTFYRRPSGWKEIPL